MHVEKYTKTAVGNVLKHYSRDFQNKDARENIDKELTKNNYNLAPDHGGQSDYEFLKNRLGEVKHLNRANINVMADWVVTLPKDYNGNEEQFFKTMYKGLESRYGQENVVSAWVHRDEPQAMPHMHFCFMPVQRTLDKDNNVVEKLNAKVVISRTELTKIHPELEKYMERNNCPCHLLNGATREGNKAVKELKQEQAIKDFKAVELLRAVQHDVVQPAKPDFIFTKGKVVPYAQYEHDVNVLNARLLRQENKHRELENQLSWQQHQYRELDKNFNIEHEEHLRLQEKQHDREYLKQQLKEVEHEQSLTHSHSRDEITIGSR